MDGKQLKEREKYGWEAAFNTLQCCVLYDLDKTYCVKCKFWEWSKRKLSCESCWWVSVTVFSKQWDGLLSFSEWCNHSVIHLEDAMSDVMSFGGCHLVLIWWFAWVTSSFESFVASMRYCSEMIIWGELAASVVILMQLTKWFSVWLPLFPLLCVLQNLVGHSQSAECLNAAACAFWAFVFGSLL